MPILKFLSKKFPSFSKDKSHLQQTALAETTPSYVTSQTPRDDFTAQAKAEPCSADFVACPLPSPYPNPRKSLDLSPQSDPPARPATPPSAHGNGVIDAPTGVKFRGYSPIAATASLFSLDPPNASHQEAGGERIYEVEIVDIHGNVLLANVSCQVSAQGILLETPSVHDEDLTGWYPLHAIKRWGMDDSGSIFAFSVKKDSKIADIFFREDVQGRALEAFFGAIVKRHTIPQKPRGHRHSERAFSLAPVASLPSVETGDSDTDSEADVDLPFEQSAGEETCVFASGLVIKRPIGYSVAEQPALLQVHWQTMPSIQKVSSKQSELDASVEQIAVIESSDAAAVVEGGHEGSPTTLSETLEQEARSDAHLAAKDEAALEASVEQTEPSPQTSCSDTSSSSYVEDTPSSNLKQSDVPAAEQQSSLTASPLDAPVEACSHKVLTDTPQAGTAEDSSPQGQHETPHQSQEETPHQGTQETSLNGQRETSLNGQRETSVNGQQEVPSDVQQEPPRSPHVPRLSVPRLALDKIPSTTVPVSYPSPEAASDKSSDEDFTPRGDLHEAATSATSDPPPPPTTASKAETREKTPPAVKGVPASGRAAATAHAAAATNGHARASQRAVVTPGAVTKTPTPGTRPSSAGIRASVHSPLSSYAAKQLASSRATAAGGHKAAGTAASGPTAARTRSLQPARGAKPTPGRSTPAASRTSSVRNSRPGGTPTGTTPSGARSSSKLKAGAETPLRGTAAEAAKDSSPAEKVPVIEVDLGTGNKRPMSASKTLEHTSPHLAVKPNSRGVSAQSRISASATRFK
ncbi:hypothetical protein CYMTET_7016 [Cymbomonas tetramitiformis]|uniref:Uncharacterized protein n=1 Tax=Cymbomonas tetramitiformis TaxID=36881 RepID=A0AAE0LHH7_9CHLO|nr:hypothetical protein CYMTET_7016 [Cymbomonas tetramitiformis]